MDIKKALDDFLQEHHYRLSLMALNGYYDTGRGVIPLHITIIPFHDSSDDLVRISVREYCEPSTLSAPAMDRDLQERVQTYDPADSGLLLFQVDPDAWSGYVEFSLARAAKLHYTA
jgi:hypothetical protein